MHIREFLRRGDKDRARWRTRVRMVVLTWLRTCIQLRVKPVNWDSCATKAPFSVMPFYTGCLPLATKGPANPAMCKTLCQILWRIPRQITQISSCREPTEEINKHANDLAKRNAKHYRSGSAKGVKKNTNSIWSTF